MTVREFFDPRTRGSTWRVEATAGVTTFMTMAYIIAVNPGILQAARMDLREATIATCLAAAVGTLLMAFLADYPFAMAPGMGMNALFAYEICARDGASWQVALGIVAIAGVVFVLLTLVGVREGLIRAMPECLKYGFACGIGLFIALIGLKNAGIVASHPATYLTLGDLLAAKGAPLVALAVTLIAAALFVRRVRGALLIGIVLMAGYALGTGQVPLGEIGKEGVVSAPRLSASFLALDLRGALALKWLVPIFVLLFFGVFDAMGTLVGVGELGGFMKNGELPRAKRALLADSLGTVAGAALGTSTVTAYIESSAGVAEGAKTGLANLFTAGLFVLAAFFAPLVVPFAQLGWVTAPALVVVGVLMLQTVTRIRLDDFTEALPAFAAMTVMPFTFSISNGLVAGFVSYAGVKLLAGRGREVHWIVYALAAIFAVGFAAIRIAEHLKGAAGA
jgi:AGZA family xanthine/uracil permease-like MFS transporter